MIYISTISSLMLISVENGCTMISTHNIILLIFFCVTNTWTQYWHSNNWIQNDYGVKMWNNNKYLPLSKSNFYGSENIRIQVYYECLCPACKHFSINELAPVVETLGPYLDIETYPFGNAKIIYDQGTLNFKSQHGPAESYGNKLHACALDKLQHTTALLHNICLMNSTDGPGSDDNNADRCGSLMNINPEPIKECAKGTRGMELLRYYGEESKRANLPHVPYILINGKVIQGDNFKSAVYNALTNPSPAYQ